MIVGAAMPRTGTMSLREALKILGFGESYHAHHIFGNKHHIRTWLDTVKGKTPNYRKMFARYDAILDSPACLYWEEIAAQHDQPHVLLLYREPNALYKSIKETVFAIVKRNKQINPALQMQYQVLFNVFFEGRFEEESFAVSKLNSYYDGVRRRAPQDRFLEYQISEGWRPLCEFLSKPVPSLEFPKKNTREKFQKRAQNATLYKFRIREG